LCLHALKSASMAALLFCHPFPVFSLPQEEGGQVRAVLFSCLEEGEGFVRCAILCLSSCLLSDLCTCFAACMPSIYREEEENEEKRGGGRLEESWNEEESACCRVKENAYLLGGISLPALLHVFFCLLLQKQSGGTILRVCSFSAWRQVVARQATFPLTYVTACRRRCCFAAQRSNITTSGRRVACGGMATLLPPAMPRHFTQRWLRRVIDAAGGRRLRR